MVVLAPQTPKTPKTPIFLDANQLRWKRVTKDKAYALMWERVIVETGAEILLRVLCIGTVSPNVFLRRLHTFLLGDELAAVAHHPEIQTTTLALQLKGNAA